LGWVEHEHRKPPGGAVHNFYSLEEVPQIESNLARICAEQHIPFALTEFSGAARIASYTRYTQVTGYCSREIDQVANRLHLRQVDSGANVRLIEPPDDGVFNGRALHDDAPVVSATQLYFDLQRVGGRGQDAAACLLDTHIRPRWDGQTQ